MPKLRRVLSAFLAIWLCVMLVAFTYTWVSRNWTPSIKSDDINIASAGALVISILSDTSAVHEEVSLNDVVGLEVDSSFTFRQVSSQDGVNFFWKDFSPTVTEDPAVFYKIDSGDTHKKDYIDTRFCLKLDDSLTTSKYIFIHPETVINYLKTNDSDPDLNKAIRISLTYEKKSVTESGTTQTVTETVILADLDDNEGVINAREDSTVNDLYQAVKSDADGKTDEADSGALGAQTVYGLQYFNCGRTSFNESDPFDESNYNFKRDASKALFVLEPGEQIWVTMRIWLEGQDVNCVKEIAGEKFNLVLKFDSVFVEE